jgi:hypothetical protein
MALQTKAKSRIALASNPASPLRAFSPASPWVKLFLMGKFSHRIMTMSMKIKKKDYKNILGEDKRQG